MQTILNFFLLGDTGPVKGTKQKHAFFKAKSAYVPRAGDRVNMNVPRDRIATMDHTDYDRYQGDFVVASTEQTPVFETTDEKAEFPVVLELIVNVYLRRPATFEVNRRQYGVDGLERGKVDHLYGDAQRAKNYAAQAESAMHAAMRVPSPMKELLERQPLTLLEAQKTVEKLYEQFPNLREWVESHVTPEKPDSVSEFRDEEE